MFFPISDSPNPPQRSYATWTLIGLNILVYVAITLPANFGQVDLRDPVLFEYLQTLGIQGRISAQQVLQHIKPYDLVVFSYGFRPAEFSFVALFTSLFLHGGFWHLAGNMLFLYIFGNNVEYRLGRLNYILVYLGCGILATLFFAVFAMGSQVPLIGASGAIFGVLGCYFLWFPKHRIRCFLFLFPFLTSNIYLPSRLVLGFYLVIDNILPFIFSGNVGSGVAHGAHIGGFLGGVVLAWGMNRLSVFHSSATDPSCQSTGFATDMPSGSGIDGELAQNVGEYLRCENCHERNRFRSGDLLDVGDFLLSQGKLEDALRLYKRFISERPRDPDLARAYFGAGKAVYQMPRQSNIAYHYFLNAREMAQDKTLRDEAYDYLRRIEGS